MFADNAAAVAAGPSGTLDGCGYGSVADRSGTGEIEVSPCQAAGAVTVASPTPASAAGRRRRDRLRAPAETPGSEPDHRLHPLTPGSAAGGAAEGEDAEGEDTEGEDTEGEDTEGEDTEGEDGEGEDGEGEDAWVSGMTYGALREGAEVLVVSSESGLLTSGPGPGDAGAGGCCEG